MTTAACPPAGTHSPPALSRPDDSAPPPQIGKRTKGRQACETSCATSCLTARRTCTSVMGIVAGQPMTRLTPMTRPLRRRICTRPADLRVAWTRLCIDLSIRRSSQEREVCPLKCKTDLHAKAKSSQGSKFSGYPRDTRHPVGLLLRLGVYSTPSTWSTKYGCICALLSDDKRRSVPRSQAHDATTMARYPMLGVLALGVQNTAAFM